MTEGWTSGKPNIDRLIKDTMYNTRYYADNRIQHKLFLEWVPYNRFTDIEPIGEGGFAKVYSATWIDGKAYPMKKDHPIFVQYLFKSVWKSYNYCSFLDKNGHAVFYSVLNVCDFCTT